MGSLRTLQEVVNALGVSTAVAQPVSAAPQGAPVSGALLEVVAEKTGYPVEMLNLDMDLEADLGIHSIKRVEILAAIEEKVPGLPKRAGLDGFVAHSGSDRKKPLAVFPRRRP